MAQIHTEVYRRFQGELRSHPFRFWPILTSGIRSNVKKKLPLMLLYLPVVIATVIFSGSNPRTRARRPIVRKAPRPVASSRPRLPPRGIGFPVITPGALMRWIASYSVPGWAAPSSAGLKSAGFEPPPMQIPWSPVFSLQLRRYGRSRLGPS